MGRGVCGGSPSHLKHARQLACMRHTIDLPLHLPIMPVRLHDYCAHVFDPLLLLLVWAGKAPAHDRRDASTSLHNAYLLIYSLLVCLPHHAPG